MILFVPLTAAALYIVAGICSGSRYEPWPQYRYVVWVIGTLSAAGAIAGPLADQAHSDFRAHMAVHLMLGMVAPFLLALAAPVTLLFRTLSVSSSRRLSRLLRRPLFRILSDPLSAAALNIGGLWLLYATDLFMHMRHIPLLHGFVHLHVFLAGYLFIASLIDMDPKPHRHSFMYRAVIMVIAFAGHGILAKYIYVRPPAGVPATQAESAAMLMYYGGDAVDIFLIFIFCLQWFKAARPRPALPTLADYGKGE